MSRWKRRAARVIIEAAIGSPAHPVPVTVTESGAANSRPGACTGTVFYADATLIQLVSDDGVMCFYYVDDDTVFFDRLALEVLDGRRVCLRVDGDGVVTGVTAAHLDVADASEQVLSAASSSVS